MDFKFCYNKFKPNNTYLKSCFRNCNSDCNAIYYNCYINKQKSFNSTKLNLIPITSNHLRFVETFKTDLNEFIYNVGGIMSL